MTGALFPVELFQKRLRGRSLSSQLEEFLLGTFPVVEEIAQYCQWRAAGAVLVIVCLPFVVHFSFTAASMQLDSIGFGK